MSLLFFLITFKNCGQKFTCIKSSELIRTDFLELH